MKIPDIPEFKPLRKLRTPKSIQDFLNEIPINKEKGGDTCTSPLVTLRRNRAHCMEGALLACLALAMQGLDVVGQGSHGGPVRGDHDLEREVVAPHVPVVGTPDEPRVGPDRPVGV